MIFFLVKKYHDYTIGNFLQAWARQLIGRIEILSYEDCAFSTRLHRGTYVFTDFERMKPGQLEFARELAPQLAKEGCRILNHPDRVLDRVTLLKKLHAAQINSFTGYRAAEDLSQVKFPCFVRRTCDHMGKMSEVIDNRAALDAEIARRRNAGEDDILVIEKLDVRSPDGLYRKYAVFRCGDRLVPRHLYVSDHWVQNMSGMVDDAKVTEEAEYVEWNPHEAQVRKTFEIAGIEYGRIDYGMLDGRVQVWEINTNPMMMAAPYRIDQRRLKSMARGTERAREAIEAIDDGTTFDAENRANLFGITIDPHLRHALGVRRCDGALRYVGRALGRLGRMPGLKEIVQTCHRARWLAAR